MHHITPETLKDLWAAVWDRGEVDVLDRVLAPDYVRINSVSRAETTAEMLKAEIIEIRKGFPDLRTTIDSIVMDDQHVAVFWTSLGTHTETFLGVPPTGATVRTSGSNFMTLSGDQLTAEQVTWDGSELLASLGVRSLRDAAPVPAEQESVVALRGEPDPELMKGFNRQFVTGVTVVTTTDATGAPRGLAVNAYASISLEPPLVLVCVQKTSSTYPALFSASHLGINILAASQTDVVGSFARSGHDKFAGLAWHTGPDGSPLIDGSSAALEAEIRERYQAQTHTVFVCRVHHAEVSGDDPMIYRAGKLYHGSNLTPLA